MPKAFLVERGQLVGMRFERVESVYDAQGKRTLQPIGAPDAVIGCVTQTGEQGANIAKLALLRAPMLILHGAEDTVVAADEALGVASSLRRTSLTWVLADRGLLVLVDAEV